MEGIGTLAAGVAHDLNNILTPILLSAEILEEESSTPQTRQILKTIADCAQRGGDMVRQVLSFARGMNGQRIEVQLKHLLKELESLLKDTFPKDIKLLFSVPNDIWTLLGDPTQVHQILLNLCVNARDAMPGGGNLIVDAQNCTLDEQYTAMNIEAAAGRYVCISVTDSGAGIPQEIIHKIFEPFFTTKEPKKGTGLGLSTVAAIVKSHKGLLDVHSEPGKATTFKVYLPAMEDGSAAKQKRQIVKHRGNGETILVVDDETSILNVTRQTLEAFGYRVLTAQDGAEAVAVYAEKKNEIAVVLTDVIMPIMDGTSLIRVLMRINPSIKIVRASGYCSDASADGFLQAGGKHLLTKPYTAETLLKTMREILEET
jgi:CheY-like chemotaxis protein